MAKTIEPLSPLFDSHCHINSSEFDEDRTETIERMKAAGLVGALVLACEVKEYEPLIALLEQNVGFLYGAWALHPEYENVEEVTVEEIVAKNRHPQMVAVGETGLDYHWCKGDLTWQKARFVRHIEAARILNKPLVIHAREAESDALDILAANNAGDMGFVMHCYGGDAATAKRAVDLGGLVSFTGVLTFKNAQDLRDVAKVLPLSSLMIETDCPYMAPVPFRGKRNEPSYVGAVAHTLADIFNMPASEVAEITTATARKFFKLDQKCN